MVPRFSVQLKLYVRFSTFFFKIQKHDFTFFELLRTFSPTLTMPRCVWSLVVLVLRFRRPRIISCSSSGSGGGGAGAVLHVGGGSIDDATGQQRRVPAGLASVGLDDISTTTSCRRTASPRRSHPCSPASSSSVSYIYGAASTINNSRAWAENLGDMWRRPRNLLPVPANFRSDTAFQRYPSARELC